MQLKKSTGALALSAIVALGGTALAAKVVPMPIRGQILQQPEGTILSTQLLGAGVSARDQAKVGSVTDIILLGNGSVKGVVIGVGGFLGLGAREIALGLEDIQIRQNSGRPEVVLAATKADLDRAAVFKTLAELKAEMSADAERQSRTVTGGSRANSGQRVN